MTTEQLLQQARGTLAEAVATLRMWQDKDLAVAQSLCRDIDTRIDAIDAHLSARPESMRCAGCDIENGCPEYCRCKPVATPDDRKALAEGELPVLAFDVPDGGGEWSLAYAAWFRNREDTIPDDAMRLTDHALATSIIADLQSRLAASQPAAAVPSTDQRDADWIMAMALALGPGSGLSVPINPEVAEFRKLFDAVRLAPVVAVPYGTEGQMLRDLLARIHRDGGHYVDEHGLDKALADANVKVSEWLANSTQEEPEIAFRLRIARLLAELHGDSTLSEQQCAKYMGIDLVSWRKLERCFSAGMSFVEGDDEAFPAEDSETVLRAALGLSTPSAPPAAEALQAAAQPVGRVRIDSGEVHIHPMERAAEFAGLTDGQLVYATPPRGETETTAEQAARALAKACSPGYEEDRSAEDTSMSYVRNLMAALDDHLSPRNRKHLRELVSGGKEESTTPAEPVKLWLWKNFVDGRPEYWAFDNPFPIQLDNGDPQTLGEPCGYALVKPSRAGRADVSEAEVLRRIAAAPAQPAATDTNLIPSTPEAEREWLDGAQQDLRRMGMPTPPAAQTAAARDVLAERRRQVEVEDWTPEHDDTHADGSLAEAAACYAMGDVEVSADNETVAIWPWSLEWWKPEGGRRRMLVKAGALILAEIERLDRLSTTTPQEAGR